MTTVKVTLWKIALTAFALVCVVLPGLPVSAALPQENPDTAVVFFNGVSLFQFYTGILDLVILKNQADVLVNIQKTPFANIPPTLNDTINNFAGSAQNICSRMLELDAGVNEINTLLQQSRFDEAAPLNNQALRTLSQAEGDLGTIETEVRNTLAQFQVAAAANGSPITTAYSAASDRIQKLNDMLLLYRTILTGQQNEILNKKSLQSPLLTLNVTPAQAFVGDTINIEGTLKADNNPLAGREISILLNGTQSIKFKTDSQGNFRVALQVPYWYVSVIQIQALYYPQNTDAGVYRAALSTITPLQVLFYKAKLVLTTDAKIYPGRPFVISGRLDYGADPIPPSREIEISLDNVPLSESEITGNFTENIPLPADMKTGKHLINVSVLASGRFAPVLADTTLNVVKAVPVITAKMPSAALIPGNFVINGKLDSETGPVAGAQITISFEGNKITATSGTNGTFTASFKKNWGFGLFGAQTLDFGVIPQEPWLTTATASYKIMIVYLVNCCIFFFILGLLSIVLPRSLKFKTRENRQSQLSPETLLTADKLPQASQIEVNKRIMADNERAIKEYDDGIFYWYRIVLQLVQKISGVLIKPNQTLREYVTATGKATGPAARYLVEFTRMIEKALYSSHKTSDDDVKTGERLAHSVQESLKK